MGSLEVTGANNGMMNIARRDSIQSLYAGQDMETRVLRVLMRWIEQAEVPSKIFSDECIGKFIERYVPCHRIKAFEYNCDIIYPNFSIPNGEKPNRDYERLALIESQGRSGLYYPKLVHVEKVPIQCLGFLYQGELTENTLVVRPEECDDLTTALFDASATLTQIRARPGILAEEMDLRYLMMRSRIDDS